MQSAEEWLSLVYRIAHTYARRYPKSELDELIQDGSIGLLKAIARFDPSRGERFDSFAYGVISGAMVDGWRMRNRGYSRATREYLQAASIEEMAQAEVSFEPVSTIDIERDYEVRETLSRSVRCLRMLDSKHLDALYLSTDGFTSKHGVSATTAHKWRRRARGRLRQCVEQGGV